MFIPGNLGTLMGRRGDGKIHRTEEIKIYDEHARDLPAMLNFSADARLP